MRRRILFGVIVAAGITILVACTHPGGGGLGSSPPVDLDTSFATGAGFNDDVHSIRVQADGKILIGGSFTSYNGTPRGCVARLNTDGSLDTSFATGAGAFHLVISIKIQPDAKILIGGCFTVYNGVARGNVARLNTDGSLDTSFATGAGADFGVWSVAPQADGKILIGGEFTSYNGTPRGCVARLNTDGSLDTSFATGAGAAGAVWTVALQADGKILIGGQFTSYDGIARANIARLNADGSLDTLFNPGTGTNGDVIWITLQADGKILIGGSFTSYNGTPRGYVARLNTDGSLDTSFATGPGANNSVCRIEEQADGKILMGGGFTSYNGTPRGYVARLNTDGSLDTSFATGAGANASVTGIALQADDKILIGGSFTTYDGIAMGRVARLLN
jgi:uncharacterized delta-60 repeat protein